MRKVLFFLGELSDQDIEWMVLSGGKVHLPAGTTLIQRGQPVEALYIVIEGSLAVIAEALEDKPLDRLGIGEIVGEMSLIEGRPPSVTVRALEDATVFAIPRRDLLARLDADHAFAAHMYKAIAMFLSDRLHDTVDRLGYGPVQQLDDDVDVAEELDPDVLDAVYLAGTRFDRMLQRLIADA
jgi:CRP/FNR family transcriptional regulator, cyclic AMP receptor protein